MEGISSKAAGGVENRKKYNGIEFENDLDLGVYDANFRELDPQTGRWWQIDPKTENMEGWSPYASNYDNPIRYSDPLGDEPGGPGDGFLRKLVGGAATVVVGVIDNALGSNIRGSVSTTISDPQIAQGWNTGLDVADVGSILGGISESSSGSSMVAGSATATVASGGLAIEVTATTAAVGVGMTVHGVYVTKNGIGNLVSQNGRVNVQGSGEGRGRNNRKPDSNATGDHTVSNERGSATYKRNDHNRSGFDEVKRVDTKGKTDNGVPTPHVHEKGTKGARPANPNEIPKTDLSKNKPVNR
ncbi:MAG: RHS repeat-associated core domain-containing protein [Chitinophagaceae bacterium]